MSTQPGLPPSIQMGKARTSNVFQKLEIRMFWFVIKYKTCVSDQRHPAWVFQEISDSRYFTRSKSLLSLFTVYTRAVTTTLSKHSYFVYLIHSKWLQTTSLSTVRSSWERLLSACMESKMHLDIPARSGLLHTPPALHVHCLELTLPPCPFPGQQIAYCSLLRLWDKGNLERGTAHVALPLLFISRDPNLSPWSTTIVQTDS